MHPDPIATGRARIDALDAEIVRLVASRAAVSAEIQAARGGGVAPGREGQILSTYGDTLGPAGRDVAAAILTLCRGPLPT